MKLTDMDPDCAVSGPITDTHSPQLPETDQSNDPQYSALPVENQSLDSNGTIDDATPSTHPVSASSDFYDDHHMSEITAQRIASLDSYFEDDDSVDSNAFDGTDSVLPPSITADHDPTSPANIMPTYRDTGTQTDTYDDPDGQLDRLNPANAQNFLSPLACLFAANLPANLPDDTIKSALQEKFQVFGQVFIKVKRDPTHLPVAFLQFASTLDCNAALHKGCNITIGERVVRLEQAKCERTLFCSSKRNRYIDDSEIGFIRTTAERFGAVESISHIPSNDAEFFNLPFGVWIKFRHYGTCQDAYRGLVRHSTWRFELIRNRAPNNRFNPFPFSKRLDYPYEYPNCYNLADPNEDVACGSAILVDGIPSTADVNQIQQLFSLFGSIQCIYFVPGYMGNHSHGLRYRVASVEFLEPYAGPAACASAARFGMAIQDASYLTWSSIDVSVTFSKPYTCGTTNMSSYDFDLSRYRKYIQNLQHPAHLLAEARREKVSAGDSSERWLPWTKFEHLFVSNQLAACAPMFGAPATKAQIEAFNHAINGYCDAGTGIWAPNGSRAKNYSLCQGLEWEDNHEPTTPGLHGSYATCSGMSPLR